MNELMKLIMYYIFVVFVVIVIIEPFTINYVPVFYEINMVMFIFKFQ